MPVGRKPKKVAIYFRVNPDAAERIKQFLADYAGKPLYVKPGEWAEAALLKSVEDIERQIQLGPVVELGQNSTSARKARSGSRERHLDNHQAVRR